MKAILKNIFLLGLTLTGVRLSAQNETDVLRLTRTPLNGSARYIGMGGAFNALGGDMSALSSNPAGAAVFLSNEFVISLGTTLNSNVGTYLNKSTGNLEPKITIPTFGIMANRNIENSKWKAINFGYTYNRLSDFNTKTAFKATDNSSLSDQFADDLYGIPDSTIQYLNDGLVFTSVPAYNTYLIDTMPGSDTEYRSMMGAGDIRKNYTTTTKGKLAENLFAFGANYNNKLYLGAAFSIVSSTFSSSELDREENVQPDSMLQYFVYQANFSSVGTGYNAKIGAIYRVADNLRFGVSVQTPTTFRMTEEYATSVTTKYVYEQDEIYAESPIGQWNYNIITPARIGFGAAYLFGKKGLISVDFNHSDLSKAKFGNQLFKAVPDQEDIDFDAANKMLSTYLGPAKQVKVGGELKIKNISLRAGYGYADNGIRKDYLEKGTSSQTISLGLGFNYENMTVDLGLANTRYSSDYYIHRFTEAASIKHSITNANVTLVFRY